MPTFENTRSTLHRKLQSIGMNKGDASR